MRRHRKWKQLSQKIKLKKTPTKKNGKKSTLKSPSNLFLPVQNTFRRYCIRFAFSSSESWKASSRSRNNSPERKTSTISPPVLPLSPKATNTPQHQRARQSQVLYSQGPKMYFWQPELVIDVIFPKKQFYFKHISGTL